MRANILQHTPNEGPGMITDWLAEHHYEVYTYHPYQFGYLPSAETTDLLIILGGPMSPNDQLSWILQERQLIADLITKHVPMLGICFGAQQIAKVLGGSVLTAPAKEVGWGNVWRQSTVITNLPAQLSVLHWHEEMFTLPPQAQLLFSNHNLTNQGFLWQDFVAGFQFHLEPTTNNVHEIVVNDYPYLTDSVLKQSAAEIMAHPIPTANRQALYRILNYLTKITSN